MTDRAKLPRRKVEALKQREDAELTKMVYQDFIETFEEAPKSSKTFVRGGTLKEEPGGTRKFETSNQGKLYKPEPTVSLLSGKASAIDEARRKAKEKAEKFMIEAGVAPGPPRSAKMGAGSGSGAKKREGEKRMSNLEAFKEELKRMQEERAERRKIRQQLKDQLGITQEENLDKIAGVADPYLGSYETDPTTTNIYLSNLSPRLTEGDLYRIFGSYGPLASVKIMWPRTDDEKSRGYMCGFVAYMARKDGERAIANLRGKVFKGFELKLGWGKSVALPPNPIYIPERMLEMTLPPPPSGLPFNAQPTKEDREGYPWPVPMPGQRPPDDEVKREAWERLLENAVVKVVIPTERPLLALVHRMIEFVIREGPLFEAMIMNRELNNPAFRFLFDNQSPAHVYYRWKLFSMLQGDPATEWSTADFQMFKNGSIWRPPPVNFFLQGMPTELYDEAITCSPGRENERTRGRSRSRSRERSNSQRSGSSARSESPPRQKKGQLSDAQRDRFEDMIRHLTPERATIAECMIYCLQHAEASQEIVDCITESLSNPDTVLVKKVARIYLVSDILANCTAKVVNASSFRKLFQTKLVEIFGYLNETYRGIEARLKAEQFRSRIVACIRSWEDTALYPLDFIINLQNIFLGLMAGCSKVEDRGPLSALDGVPLDTAPLDGIPLGAESSGSGSEAEAAEPAAAKEKTPEKVEDPAASLGMFVRSKWEEVEPEVVEAQAVTSSKWEALDTAPGGRLSNLAKPGGMLSLVAYDDDLDGVPMDEDNNSSEGPSQSEKSLDRRSAGVISQPSKMSDEKRAKLREVEVKVMEYQDDLETERKRSGRSPNQQSVAELVQKYRQKLLDQLEDELNESRQSSQVSSPAPAETTSRKKKSGRNRSRSRTPTKKSSKRSKRSRSRSPTSSSKHKKHRRR